MGQTQEAPFQICHLMKQTADKNFFLILLLSALVYSSNIWGISIYILDEAKNASCAMEMLRRSDWVVPTFNGELRTDKPPLHYYFMMLAYSVGGVNPFTARVFQALAGVFLVGFIYRFLKTRTNTRVAVVSSLIIMSCFQLHVQFHLAVPDPFLIVWLVVTMLSFYDFVQGNNKSWKWMFIGAGCGFLAKGPVAVALPALVAVLYLLVTQQFNFSVLRRLKLFQGLLIFLLVAIPWYVAVGLETNGEWLKGFFLQHNIGRFTSTMEGHRGYFIVPPLILLVAVFPFSLFIIPAVRQAWREKGLFLFALTAATVIVLFFMFSKTFLPGYISPAIPFLAMVLGNYLSTTFQWLHRWLWIVPASLLAVTALAGGVVYAVYHEPEFSDMRGIMWFTLVLPVGFILSGYFFIRRKLCSSFVSAVAGWVIFSGVFFYVIFPAADRHNPVKKSENVRKLYAHFKPVAYGIFNPAFVFEYKRDIPRFNDRTAFNTYIQHNPNSLILARSSAIEELTASGKFKVIFRQRDLFEQSETVILVPELDPAPRLYEERK